MDPANNPGSVNPGTNMPPQQPPAMPMPGAMPQQPGSETVLSGQPQTVATGADVSWLPPTAPVGAGGGQAGSSAQAIVPAPVNAEDGDVIEKEWVVKAKRIVDQTRQDPYKQTRELHKFRSEYMKKRYNKIIEPVEE